MATKTERGGKLKRRKPAPEPAPPRALLPVRITPELIDRVDAVRPDLIPREPFIRHLLDLALTQLEEEG